VKLPNHHKLIIRKPKIVDYLLSSLHPYGRHKAALFRSFGFSANAWLTFARALARHAANGEVIKVEDTPFGRRYIVEGTLSTPDARNPFIRSVRFVENGDDVPRFLTAYPSRKK
jgi:hypothetical protein